MGFMDKIKELFGGKQEQITEGIDKTAEAVKEKIPDQHGAKVDQVADKAKDVVENLASDSSAGEPATGQPAAPPAAAPRAEADPGVSP